MTKRKTKKHKPKRNSQQVHRPAVNRQYKDTVFRMLFSNRENLLSLYNAINKTAYTDPEQLEIVTLENAVYMGMKNDLAFLIDTNLFLFEHQSTFNPNMPLRDLFYISQEYQSIIDHKSLYSSVLLKIPAPNFIVFYNGIEKKSERWVNHLSDAFIGLSGKPNLDLTVLTLNINDGYNKELVEQCRVLKEYMVYVTRVRNFSNSMSLEHAVNRAVDSCIRDGILENFLRKHRAEVIAMSIFEYNEEEEKRKLRKAEFEAGKESAKKEIFLSLYKKNMSLYEISDLLKVDENIAQQWFIELSSKSE